MGCGLGDTLGLIIGTVLGWTVFPTMILAVFLGFVGGYGLTMVPLLKRGIAFKRATQITIASETASITVMEAAENTTAFLIPGVLLASVLSPLFWFGMAIAVVVGFLAAYPVNYYMISRGQDTAHTHH
mgnify:CR=1 FL=1|tara:strand:- start:2559 stop:2942 length:384 start_codon:yes stop_codon:yes gene_type:complete